MRTSDWSAVDVTQVPRLKLEYQLARPLFVRLVGQYVSDRQDALRDDGRTDRPILRLDAATAELRGRRPPSQRNDVRLDALLSYRPTPGTVLFLGYGGSLDEERAFRFRGLERRRRRLLREAVLPLPDVATTPGRGRP